MSDLLIVLSMKKIYYDLIQYFQLLQIIRIIALRILKIEILINPYENYVQDAYEFWYISDIKKKFL